VKRMPIWRWRMLGRDWKVGILLGNWVVGGRYSFQSDSWVWSIGPLSLTSWRIYR